MSYVRDRGNFVLYDMVVVGPLRGLTRIRVGACLKAYLGTAVENILFCEIGRNVELLFGGTVRGWESNVE